MPLSLVLAIITILDTAALAFIIGLFLISLIMWTTRKRVYSWGRHVDRAPADMSLSLFHAPMIAATIAIGTGISINYITDANSSTATYAQGTVGMLIYPLIMMSLSMRLLRRTTDRRSGIPLIRNRLARCLACRTRAPSDLEPALAWLGRVQRFGNRLTARAEGMTFLRWTQRRPKASRLMVIAWPLDVVSGDRHARRFLQGVGHPQAAELRNVSAQLCRARDGASCAVPVVADRPMVALEHRRGADNGGASG